MTQQALADLVSVNRVTYKNWENGKREPELDKVVEPCNRTKFHC
ncbi:MULTISPECIES: helix-turn-helix transcriptional regulator [Listeria]